MDESTVGPGTIIGYVVLALVAVPILLLGAVSPWAIRLAVGGVEEAGRVAGRLYALSTAGSLFGTLVSALILIPLVGTRRTFLVFALAIALIAVWGLRPVRRYALAPASIAVLRRLGMRCVGERLVHASARGRDELCLAYELAGPGA